MLSCVSGCTVTLTRPARVHCLTAVLTCPLQARTVIHIYNESKQSIKLNAHTIYSVAYSVFCRLGRCYTVHGTRNSGVRLWIPTSLFLHTHESISIRQLSPVTRHRLTLPLSAADTCVCQATDLLRSTMTSDDTSLRSGSPSYAL